MRQEMAQSQEQMLPAEIREPAVQGGIERQRARGDHAQTGDGGRGLARAGPGNNCLGQQRILRRGPARYRVNEAVLRQA